ncbi:MAG: hypothetical protein AAGF81_20790 [Pseudomonadota bacterium]
MLLQPNGPDPDQADAVRREMNARVLFMTGVSLAIVGAYASIYPTELAMAMFSMLATWAALGTAFVALILSHRVFADHLNLWDKALFLSMAALMTGALVDAGAVTAFIEANAPAAVGAGTEQVGTGPR